MGLLPSLKLQECEETALTLQWNNFNRGGVKLQYKVAMAAWNDCNEIDVTSSEGKCDLFGLEPGTPYSLRLKAGGDIGTESVYDTLPIGCTPKKRKTRCVIS